MEELDALVRKLEEERSELKQENASLVSKFTSSRVHDDLIVIDVIVHSWRIGYRCMSVFME